MTVREQQSCQAAVDKAVQLQGWTRVRWAGWNIYRVRGETARYTVTVLAPFRYACTCEASQRGLVACWHRAALHLRIVSRSMVRRPLAA